MTAMITMTAEAPFPDAPVSDREDLAALLHFSAYIAKEARRLGLPETAKKAEMIKCDLIFALENA